MSVIIVLVVINPSREVKPTGEAMFVVDVEKAPIINGAIAPVVERGVVGTSGDSFQSRTIHSQHRKVTVDDFRKELLGLFVIAILGDPVVGCRAVEFREKQ